LRSGSSPGDRGGRSAIEGGGADAAGSDRPTQARRAAIARRPVSHQPNPAVVEQSDQRAKSIENRIADRITAFAGSMPFV
jgi:hypothetical protein